MRIHRQRFPYRNGQFDSRKCAAKPGSFWSPIACLVAHPSPIFAATGICESHESQATIAQRVGEWVFHYRSDEDRQEHATLQAATAFLEKNRDLFPPGTLPRQPGPLAIDTELNGATPRRKL